MPPPFEITPSLYIANAGKAVAAQSGCEAEHVSTASVHEMLEGKTVWNGKVEVFKVIGHPKTDTAYSWGFNEADGQISFIAVLGVPPINSPREAVQAAIAGGFMV